MDGDGEITIADVTAIIDILLAGDTSGVDMNCADCDVDGSLSIADVTALIDYLLTGSWDE